MIPGESRKRLRSPGGVFMTTRMRYAIVLLLALVALAVAGRRLLYPSVSPRAATISSTPSQSYLVILGVGDTAGTTWDGSIAATGATILSLQPWRFGGADSISGTTSWKLATRNAPTFITAGPVQENGVIVTISAATGPVTFDVKTAQGNFSFSSQDVPFGTIKPFLSGKARVAQTAAPLQLTSSAEDEDFPSMAQSGDDVYLTSTRYVHSDRTKAVPLATNTPITDFPFLPLPTRLAPLPPFHY